MDSRPLRTAAACQTAQARRRTRGFTLIEILVVIVIISVIVSAATIAVGVLGGDRQAEDQARRLWAVLQQAREESELQGFDAGVYLAAGAYEFLRFQPRANAWQPIPEDPLYVPRQIPNGLRFRARLDGTEIVLKPQLETRRVTPLRKLSDDEARQLGADDDDGLGAKKDGRTQDDKDNPPPQIVLLASGEIMPFELEFERDGAAALWRVIGTADNDLRVERRDPGASWQIMAQTNPPADEEIKSSARR